jgi:calpain-15
MWVLLLEKAYAKLHGNYWTLRGGFANEGMIDLTGCPSTNYDFTKPSVIKMIENGDLFKEMIRFDEQGYLLSASTPGEDRWTGKNAEVPAGGLVPGHAYSVIQVREALGNRLVNIRNPWGRFEWDGDWHDNDTNHWTDEMIALI